MASIDFFFFFSSRRRHTRSLRDWSSDVCSSDLTYYLGLGDGRALCLVPRGMEEGEKLEIAEPEFELLANRPVSFPLLTATDRSAERAGEIVAAGGLAVLPPIRTVLRFGRKLVETALPIHLEVRLTEIGTLDLW